MLLDPAINFLSFLVLGGKVGFQVFMCFHGYFGAQLGEAEREVGKGLLTICH